jgi:hypothetical protein
MLDVEALVIEEFRRVFAPADVPVEKGARSA